MPFGEIFGKLMDTLVGGPVVKPFPKEPVKFLQVAREAVVRR